MSNDCQEVPPFVTSDYVAPIVTDASSRSWYAGVSSELEAERVSNLILLRSSARSCALDKWVGRGQILTRDVA